MNAPSSSALQAAVVALDQAQSIKPFGLDMKILLSTEATGGAIAVPAIKVRDFNFTSLSDAV